MEYPGGGVQISLLLWLYTSACRYAALLSGPASFDVMHSVAAAQYTACQSGVAAVVQWGSGWNMLPDQI